MTRWLHHSLVLAADFRVVDAGDVGPALRRTHVTLAGLGAHHALVYESTTEPGRVLVMIAIHARDPLLELIRSPTIFEWFDAMDVADLPAVFAGELIEHMTWTDTTITGPRPTAPEVMVAIVTPVDDLDQLAAHIEGTVAGLRADGVRMVLAFSAFDDPHEVMMLLHIDEDEHARSWLHHSDLAAEWLHEAGFGAYPPAFVGIVRAVVDIG